ncbi:ATP-binding protein [Chitinimonas koreensis]|uniref:ATP-binding protein n=1 Tax=Chitinimonas koreensis TaxID=356302 RepID=UPI0004233B7F|nr:ATP-binding protein [Chitinimonas koreensis]QNM95289.1 HAMP domain-containing protein [Chitinimonas koreensis]
MKLRRLVDSLFGRTALVLLLTVAASHATAFLLFRWIGEQDGGPGRHGAMLVEALVRSERARWQALSGSERAALLHAPDDGGVVWRAAAPAGLRPPQMPPERDLARALQPLLAAAARPGEGSRPPRMWLPLQLDDGIRWLGLPAELRRNPPPRPDVFLSVLIAAFGLLGALVLLWPLYRPLRRLAGAQAALGRGEAVQPLPESGPRELAALAGGFNRMAASLAELESERRTLLAGVSHDLRTPLARLRMRIALLDETDPQPYDRDLDDIERITEQFLAYVRGEADDGPRETLDVGLLLADLAERYGAAAGIAVAAPAGLAATLDRLAIGRALGNLVDNALTHGAPPIELRAEALGGELLLSVRDHGPGLGDEALREAIRPFRRLDPARSRGGHCGLGLAIAARVARRHGGELAMARADGGGLVVSLVLRGVLA